MEFIKKNIKFMILVVLLIIIASGISVYATSTYLASQVTYTKNGETMSVAEALNELYEKNGNSIKNIDLSKVDFLSDNYTFNGSNSYEFNDNYDMVLIASSGGSDYGKRYYLNDNVIDYIRWIYDGNNYIMSGIIINVKKGDILKTDAATYPTSINLLKQK